MLRLIRNIIVVIIIFLILIFGFFNYVSTRVDLLWTATHAPLSVLMGASFLVGLILALLFCGVRLASQRRRLSRTRRQLKKAEDELANWRQSPAKNA